MSGRIYCNTYTVTKYKRRYQRCACNNHHFPYRRAEQSPCTCSARHINTVHKFIMIESYAEQRHKYRHGQYGQKQSGKNSVTYICPYIFLLICIQRCWRYLKSGQVYVVAGQIIRDKIVHAGFQLQSNSQTIKIIYTARSYYFILFISARYLRIFDNKNIFKHCHIRLGQMFNNEMIVVFVFYGLTFAYNIGIR